MKRLFCIAVALAFCLTLTGSADDAKKEIAPKGQLPANFGRLGLSDEQKSKIYAVQSKHKAKIDELKKQLAEIEKEQRTAIFEVLTDAQKARLKELALEKVPGGGSGNKPDKPTSDKPKQ